MSPVVSAPQAPGPPQILATAQWIILSRWAQTHSLCPTSSKASHWILIHGSLLHCRSLIRACKCCLEARGVSLPRSNFQLVRDGDNEGWVQLSWVGWLFLRGICTFLRGSSRIKPPVSADLKEAGPHLGFSFPPGSFFLPPQVCILDHLLSRILALDSCQRLCFQGDPNQDCVPVPGRLCELEIALWVGGRGGGGAHTVW